MAHFWSCPNSSQLRKAHSALSKSPFDWGASQQQTALYNELPWICFLRWSIHNKTLKPRWGSTSLMASLKNASGTSLRETNIFTPNLAFSPTQTEPASASASEGKNHECQHQLSTCIPRRIVIWDCQASWPTTLEVLPWHFQLTLQKVTSPLTKSDFAR